MRECEQEQECVCAYVCDEMCVCLTSMCVCMRTHPLARKGRYHPLIRRHNREHNGHVLKYQTLKICVQHNSMSHNHLVLFNSPIQLDQIIIIIWTDTKNLCAVYNIIIYARFHVCIITCILCYSIHQLFSYMQIKLQFGHLIACRWQMVNSTCTNQGKIGNFSLSIPPH